MFPLLAVDYAEIPFVRPVVQALCVCVGTVSVGFDCAARLRSVVMHSIGRERRDVLLALCSRSLVLSLSLSFFLSFSLSRTLSRSLIRFLANQWLGASGSRIVLPFLPYLRVLYSVLAVCAVFQVRLYITIMILLLLLFVRS